jgi:hypothetical protein
MADFCRFVDGFGVFSGEQMVPRRGLSSRTHGGTWMNIFIIVSE